jgi:hypothetical protein
MNTARFRERFDNAPPRQHRPAIKHSDRAIDRLRRLAASGRISQREAARRVGITWSHARAIIRGEARTDCLSDAASRGDHGGTHPHA